MTAAKRPWHKSASTWLAIAFVLGAGAIAWYGSGMPGKAAHGPAGPTETLAGRANPTPSVIPQNLPIGGLPTRLVVSNLGIDAPIAEVGVVRESGRPVWEVAWQSVGHNYDSALPGQPGNMVLTGHVSVADSNNKAWFKKLDKVSVGDDLDVYSGDQMYHYKVSKVSVVAPDAVKVLRSDAGATVTLITCTHDLKNRLVVVGTLA
jgi:LPXTG-site transpeptidase (sortase) family protein